MDLQIDLPYNYKEYRWQIPIVRAFFDNKEIWMNIHRRGGKDLLCFCRFLLPTAFKRPGTYPYVWPTLKQGRDAIWEGKDEEGRDLMKYYVPQEMIIKKDNADMKLTVQAVGGTSQIQIFGTNGGQYEALRGKPANDAVFAEHARQDPRGAEVVSPMLLKTGGRAIYNSTPNGNNHFKRGYHMAKMNPDTCYHITATVDDTFDHNGNRLVTEADIQTERDKGKTEDYINQEFFCFPPDTDVICQDEVKYIKDVKIGDFVLTHSNRYRKVKGINEREYKGQLIHIKTIGNRKDIICTPEHRIRISNDGKNNKWVEAQNLTLDDKITFPKILKKKQKIISEDLVTLLAWYICEGSSSKGAVQYSLHEDEESYHQEIEKCASNLGYHCTTNNNEENHTKEISVCSVDLVEFMIRNCGSGALNKKIPFDLIAGYEELVYEILINGDGMRIKNTKEMYSTVSKTLAYQMQLLAHQLGYGAGILTSLPPKKILSRQVNSHKSYCVNIYKIKKERKPCYPKHWVYYKSHKYNVTVPVKSIEYEEYEGLVYNIEVMYDKSYTANGRVVHNCSFNQGIEGTYLGKQMQVAYNEGRILSLAYDETVPVYTAWDLGVGDFMAIVFYQMIGNWVHIIDYLEATGYSFLYYAQKLKERKEEKGYYYGTHYAPFDIKNREMGSDGQEIMALSRKEKAEKVDIIFEDVEKTSFINSVDNARAILRRCKFNSDSKGVNLLISHLEQWGKRWNDINQEYGDTEASTVHKHGGAAFRYMSTVVTEETHTADWDEIDEGYKDKCNEFVGL